MTTQSCRSKIKNLCLSEESSVDTIEVFAEILLILREELKGYGGIGAAGRLITLIHADLINLSEEQDDDDE